MAGTDVTSSTTWFEAFGVPFALEADIVNSSLGQAGPRAYPVVPVADGEGRYPTLTLGTSGEQDAGVSVDIVTRIGGNVGEAAGSWKLSTDSSTEYRGLDLPVSQNGIDLTNWTDTDGQTCFNAVVLADSRVVCAYASRTVPGGAQRVRVKVWSPSLNAWGAAVTVVSGLSATFDPWPCLVLLDDGRLLIFYWNCNDTTFVGQIDVQQSRDDGATWAPYAYGIIPPDPSTFSTAGGLPLLGGGAAWNTTPNRIAAVVVNQQLVLMYGVLGDVPFPGDGAVSLQSMWHYASNNLGASLNYVDHYENDCRPMATVCNGVAWFGWAGVDPVDATLYVCPVSPWNSISNSPDRISVGVIGTAATGGGGVISLTWAEFGMYSEGADLFVPYVSGANTHGGFVWRINTLSAATQILNFWGYDGQTPALEYAFDICAVNYRRQGWVIGRFESASATYEKLLTVWWLGGYSSVTMPLDGVTVTDSAYGSYYNHYQPTISPTGYGYTFAGAGTESVTTTPGWNQLVTAAQQAYYYRALTSGATDGHLWLFRMRRIAGGIVSDTRIGATLRHAGVGYGYKAAIQISATQIRVVDVYGAVTRGTLTLAAGTWEIRFAIAAGFVTVHARVYTQGWDRQWEVVCNGAALTDDGGGGGTTNLIEWGNITATGNNTSEWQMVNGTGGNDTGAVNEADGFTNPTDLRPMPYLAQPAYLAAGVYLTAQGGAAATGDTYAAYPDAEYAQRFAVPRGSPDSQGYVQGGQRPGPTVETRSLETAVISFPAFWRWTFPGDVNQTLPPVVIFQFVGLNTESVAVRRHVFGGASVAIGTHDQTINSYGLLFERTGPIVTCDDSGASTTSPWFDEGELIGGWAIDNANVSREIVDNTSGKWGNSGDAELPVITLGGDYASFGSSGTMRIIPPSSTFVWFNTGGDGGAGFELYYSTAPYTAEGYIQLPVFAPCTGKVPYTPSNWNQERTEAEAAEVLTSEYGVDFPRRAHTNRRTRGLMFDYLVYNGRNVQRAATLGERVYFRATTTALAPIVATSGDTQQKMRGIFLGSDGGAVPIVHVGRVARGTPNTQSITLGYNVGLLGLATQLPTQAAEMIYEGGGTSPTAIKMNGAWTLREIR